MDCRQAHQTRHQQHITPGRLWALRAGCVYGLDTPRGGGYWRMLGKGLVTPFSTEKMKKASAAIGELSDKYFGSRFYYLEF